MKLVGIAGSLRKGSLNRALLTCARDSMPQGAELVIASLDDIPLYNGDIEAAGMPAAVEMLKDQVAAADGLVVATPEYNGGIPGVLKNTFDWVSRPMSDQPRVLHGKPIALLGATPGGLGTTLAQIAWLQVLRALKMRLWTAQGSFYLSGAMKSFDDAGVPTDEALVERVRAYMAGFVEFVR